MRGAMTVEEMLQEAERIRQARRNPLRLTRERALKLFHEHRKAARASRLGWMPERSEGRTDGDGDGGRPGLNPSRHNQP